MKNLTYALITLLMALNVQAAIVVCSSSDGGYSYRDRHIVIGGEITGLCQTVKVNDGAPKVDGDEYTFRISGFGPGLQVSASDLVLTCPTAKKSNLHKRPFFGIKASAAWVVGVDAGVFANGRGGVCFLTGVKAGTGVSVMGAKLVLKKK